jgi:hypothetical protein
MVLLSGLLLALAGCAEQPFAASFAIGVVAIPEGESKSVQISIINPPDAKTFQIGPTGAFIFDPAVATVTSVNGLNGFQVFASAIDNVGGRVRFSAGFPGGSIRPILNSGISMTELPIIEIKFTAVGAAGTRSVLTITGIDLLADRNGKDIIVADVKAGEIKIE